MSRAWAKGTDLATAAGQLGWGRYAVIRRAGTIPARDGGRVVEAEMRLCEVGVSRCRGP